MPAIRVATSERISDADTLREAIDAAMAAEEAERDGRCE